MGRVARENGVVDNDAVDSLITVGLYDFLLKLIALDLTKGKRKATSSVSKTTLLGEEGGGVGTELVLARFLRPLGVLDGSGVIVGKKRSETGLPSVRLRGLHFSEALLDFGQQALGNRVGEDDLARLWC